MVSNYRTLVGWLKIIDWKKISISPSWSIRGTESEFICRSGRKWKNVGISGVSAGTQWIEIHSAKAVQAVQINGHVIKWSNAVSCLAGINVNDNSSQMSVKRIRLYIKAKRYIRDNLAHQEQSTHSPNSQTLFFYTTTNFNTPPQKKQNSTSSHSRHETCDKVGRKLYFKQHICSTVDYFDLLSSNFNKSHAVDRFLRSVRPIYIHIHIHIYIYSFLWRFGTHSTHGLSFY